MQVNWSGVYPATTTQFGLDQSLDIPATVQHAVNLVDAGVDGLVMLGTVGENCSLEMAEKLDVLRATMTAVQGRVPVLTGVAEYTTAAAINLANAARVEGIDGIMLLPGMVYRSDPRETMAHFRAVAADGGLPVMCYNNPPAYGVDITPEMFASLVDEPNLVAIKESSDDPRRITDIVNLCGDRYILFCGVDDLIVEAAALDGANPIQRFFTIVFPLLSPTFFFLLFINVTDSFTEGFGIINVMTQGGPGGATNILVYKLYQDGFIGLDLSSSSAQSVILMVLVILLTFVQFRWIERRIHYAE